MPGVRISLNTLKPKGFRGEPQTIGEHIKAKRLALGRYQKDVARELGVDQWTLLNWEKNWTVVVLDAVNGPAYTGLEVVGLEPSVV